jgi:hypothetical protein
MRQATAAEIIARKREAKKEQARHIKAFCSLRRLVNEEVYAFTVPSDCLCEENEQLPDDWNWKDSGDVMAYIEAAVLHAIATGYGRPEEAQ